jgi:WD40 repeat protein
VKSQVTHNTFFAASEDGILKSADFGATWTIYNNALPTRRLTSLIISPYSDTMFVSTETHGVLKVWNFVTSARENPNVPDRTELFQNYPNPFNPTTTIRFEIPHSSFVTVKVFDVLGREVATLVNEEMRAGRYERIFDGGNFASGIYVYHLNADNYVATRKLVLIK